ncbi:MAG: hypothetical protein WCG52_07605 [bacterium]
MLDIDTTVKTVFGRQEGAEVGYNPHKPGRPSHSYHTYWIARLRLCLDVEVRPGNQNSASHGMPGLWELIDSLPHSLRPHAIRGDCNYGSQGVWGGFTTQGPLRNANPRLARRARRAGASESKSTDP